MQNPIISTLLVIAVAALPSAARADLPELSLALPYSSSVSNAGPGFKLGSTPLVLHTGVATEVGYDSNVLYDPVPVAGAVMRLRAHAALETVSYRAPDGETESVPPVVAFRLGAQVEYREYLTASSQLQASRNFNVLADTSATLYPRGRISLTLSDAYARTSDPVNVENTHNVVRDLNRFGVVGRWRANGGSLELSLGDIVHVSYMGENAHYAFASSYGTEAQAIARWWILPQTSVALSVRAGYYRYPDNPSQDSAPVRVLAGGSTLLTSWLGASASVGYGNSFNQQGPSYNNAIGSAEIDFYLPWAAKLLARYEREFSPSVFANFYRDDQFAVAYKQPLVAHLSATLAGAIYLRTFEGLISPALINAVSYSSTTHTGPIYEARAEINVQPIRWLSCGAAYTVQADTTDFVFHYASFSTADRYLKHSVFGRIDVAY